MKKLSFVALALAMSSAAFASSFTVVDNSGGFRVLATPKSLSVESSQGSGTYKVTRFSKTKNGYTYQARRGKTPLTLTVSKTACATDKSGVRAVMKFGVNSNPACAYKGLEKAH